MILKTKHAYMYSYIYVIIIYIYIHKCNIHTYIHYFALFYYCDARGWCRPGPTRPAWPSPRPPARPTDANPYPREVKADTSPAPLILITLSETIGAIILFLLFIDYCLFFTVHQYCLLFIVQHKRTNRKQTTT